MGIIVESLVANWFVSASRTVGIMQSAWDDIGAGLFAQASPTVTL